MENHMECQAYNNATKSLSEAINNISNVIMECPSKEGIDFVEKQQDKLYNILKTLSKNRDGVMGGTIIDTNGLEDSDLKANDDSIISPVKASYNPSNIIEKVGDIEDKGIDEDARADDTNIIFYGYSQIYQNHFEFSVNGVKAKILRGTELPIDLLDVKKVGIDEPTRMIRDSLRFKEVKKKKTTSSKGNDSVLVLTEDSPEMHIRMVIQLITNRDSYALTARAHATEDILNLSLRDYLNEHDSRCVTYREYLNKHK